MPLAMVSRHAFTLLQETEWARPASRGPKPRRVVPYRSGFPQGWYV